MMKYWIAAACFASSWMLGAEEPETFNYSQADNLKVRALENYNNALRTEVPGESIKMLLQSIRENPRNESPRWWLVRIAVENKSLNQTGKELFAIALDNPRLPRLSNVALDMMLYGRNNIGKEERSRICQDILTVLRGNSWERAQGTENFSALLNLLYRYNFLAYDRATYLDGETAFDRSWDALTPAQRQMYAGLFLSYFANVVKYKDQSNPFWFPFGKTPYEETVDRVRAMVLSALAPKAEGFRMEDLDAVAIAVENLNDLELLKAYEKALVNTDYLKNPNNANTLAYLKAVLNYDLDDAERLASFAVLQENNAAFWDTLAWVYYRQKKYDKAKEAILKAFNGKDIQFGENVINEHAGDIFAAAGDKVKAKEYYQKALQSDAEVRFEKSAVEQKLKALEQD